jgi:hypothetical protein
MRPAATTTAEISQMGWSLPPKAAMTAVESSEPMTPLR